MEFLGIPSFGSENVDEEMIMKRGDFDFSSFTPTHFMQNDYVHIQQSIFKDDYEDVNLCEKILIETSQDSCQSSAVNTDSIATTTVDDDDRRCVSMVTDVNADVVVDAMTMSNPLQGDMVVRTFTQLLAAQDKPRPQSDKPRPQSDKPRPSPADKPGVCAPQEKQKYKCTECNKSYGTQQSLDVHGRIHRGERRFQCVECSKAFITAGNLKAHMRVHSGEKPYKCKHASCDRSFAEINTLKKHMLTHTGIKPYTCSICQRSYSQISSRNVHMKRNHPNDNIVKNNRLMKNTSQDKNFNTATFISINENI